MMLFRFYIIVYNCNTRREHDIDPGYRLWEVYLNWKNWLYKLYIFENWNNKQIIELQGFFVFILYKKKLCYYSIGRV